METEIIDTIVEDTLIRIPQKFKNKHVKIIIIDSEENKKPGEPVLRKLNFKIDETLKDVIPFLDIKDSSQFVEKLREEHWQ